MKALLANLKFERGRSEAASPSSQRWAYIRRTNPH
jgi:hypothetical protein